MNIRAKVAALLGSLFAILGAAAVLVAMYVVMPSFAQLERADARTQMRRVGYALDGALYRLQISATDWGNRADIYQYAVDHNRGLKCSALHWTRAAIPRSSTRNSMHCWRAPATRC